MEGELINVHDAHWRYPIRDGVPRLVQTEQLGMDQRETIDAFSYKWSQIPGYGHEQATKSNRERWVFERFGFPRGDTDVADFLRDARFVLEAGTGPGIDTDLLVRNFTGQLFGVDISSAIDLAYKRFGGQERVVLLQADIAKLPFRSGFFDVISCDQVLHHTPDPPATFQRLATLLRPGGRILLYVYRVKGPIREFTDDHLRSMVARGSPETCLALCEKLTRLGRNLSHLRAVVEVEDDIPELGIQRGCYDVQRLIYDHVLKCFWNDAYDFGTNAMINFDWYRPLHAFRYREEEVRAWAADAGLEIEHFQVSPSGISTILKRP